ncbi:MAG: hypothetical protein WCN98_06495 [Verrucomicrobiaceae bacterium]
MIDRVTGALNFKPGHEVRPHGMLPPEVPKNSMPFQVDDIFIYVVGIWDSDHGPLVVGLVVNAERRIQGALLCHWVAHYRNRAPGDTERRAYHESIILIDLAGQREFPWGKVDCRHDNVDNRNWLVISYASGPQVPALPPEVFSHLSARESEYDIEDEGEEELFIKSCSSCYTINQKSTVC